ncbi:MAG: TonB family protein [Acidobacteriota bacterium]
MDAELFANHILGESVSATVAGSVLKALPAEGDPEVRLVHHLPAAVAETPEAERVVLKNARDWGKVRDLRALNLLEAGREGKNSLYAVTEYHQGRLLSDILDRLRHEGLPLAPDQAVYLAERTAGALLSLAEQGITAGGLSPDRVSVSFEGEVKLLPTLLKDLQTTPLLKDPAFDAYWRYLPPAQAAGKSAKAAADIYSVGALLFEFLCREPFRPAPSEPFDPASRLEEGRRGLDGADPLPDNLHRILKRSLLQEEPEAYGDLKVLKADLDQLITSGEYSPTTFNIAFLMHSLYRGEDEAEDSADKAFAALDRAPFRREEAPPTAPPPAPAPAAASPASEPKDLPSSFSLPSEEPAESPLASRKYLLVGAGIAAGVVLLALVLFLALRPKGPSEEQIRAQQQMADLEKERAQFKAQQEEMAAKLKALEDEKAALQQQVTKATTADEKVRAQKALEETQNRLRAQQEEQKRLAAEKVKPAETAPAASAPSEPAGPAASAPPTAEAALGSALEAPSEAAPSPPPAAKVQTGDFVELWAVDIKPKQTNQLQLDVTSPARQNRLKGTFYVEVSVDETGAVTDAKVVRGPVPDYGMNDSCRRAGMKLRYSPALKDGVPVKTKVTFPIVMK